MSNLIKTAKLRALSSAFRAGEISWKATKISNSGAECEFTPMVSLAAYQRRLGEVLGVWYYKLRFLPESKAGHGNRIIAECILDLPDVGSYRAVGDVPGDLDRAWTNAESEAYRNACIAAGLGGNLRPLWVGINSQGQPRFLPGEPGKPQPSVGSGPSPKHLPRNFEGARPDGTNLNALRQEVGEALYREAVSVTTRSYGSVESPVAQRHLSHRLRSIARGIHEAKSLTSRMPDYQFHSLLEDHGVASLLDIPSLEALIGLVRDMRTAASKEQQSMSA